MSQDEALRDLERRLAADPSDDDARIALALARLRGGEREAARAALDASSAAGYRLLCERASRESALLALLDAAPEWRSSGGDPGCSRWSSAEPVRAPRTAWRRRIEEVHAALALAVDRGRAYVVTLGPRGTELVALSVFTGETLWRFALGHGAPAAPLAREGWVHAAIVEGEVLKTFALDASGGVVWHAEDACPADALPGALNVARSELVLPVATTWRGSSRVPDATARAFVIARDASSGRNMWHAPAEQVFAEVPVHRDALYVARDYVRGSGHLSARRDGVWQVVEALDGVPHFFAARGDGFARAVGGMLRAFVDAMDQLTSIGGAITSLAFDGERVLVGRGAEFAVRAARANGALFASWSTHESPLPYRPRGVAHAPPAPRSAVCARDTCYLASPLAPSLVAYSTRTGAVLWRHEIADLLVPEDGPRFTWPTSEAGPPDRGPLHLAPLPGRVLGVTLSGYVFAIEG